MIKKRAVLVIDDEYINRKNICKILKKEYFPLEAASVKVALAVLENYSEQVAAIILAFRIDDIDFYTFLAALKTKKAIGDLPVIVVLPEYNAAVELRLLSLGANDVIAEPVDINIILYRLANLIKLRETPVFNNAIERDWLTGVYNREIFYQKAAKILNSDTDNLYDLFCLDIKRFKLINELFGVKEGDKLLQSIGKGIENVIAGQGICGRISGDIFAILYPHKKIYTQADFAEWTKKLQEYPLNINLEFKCGIYCIDDIYVPLNVMCDRARLAAATIKDKYKLCYAYYDHSLREKLLKEQHILDNMRQALEQNQFQVYFQPKYDLRTEGIIGAEALVRWLHPERGFMPPSDFIPLFERNGFVTELDIYVWDRTCQKIREWLDAGYAIVPISVNVSRADLYKNDIDKIIINIVKKYNLLPEFLHLEITETAYTQNPAEIIRIVGKLKKLGFIIDMDDFGSGYSSLNMLSQLPIDILKLDMNFMQNITAHYHNKTILSFIISLAKELGLQIVAEGVETLSQVQMLRDMDCDFAQGYYYAKPMPENDFKLLLAHNSKAAKSAAAAEFLLSDSSLVNTAKLPKGSGTMLIVDDSRFNRTILAEIFRKYFNVIEAENGLAAMNYINKHSENIAIIMLDLAMPVMDGFTVLEKLAEDTSFGAIPVIVTSQLGHDAEVEAFNRGAVDFIHHPYNSSVIMARVKNAIANRRN